MRKQQEPRIKWEGERSTQGRRVRICVFRRTCISTSMTAYRYLSPSLPPTLLSLSISSPFATSCVHACESRAARKIAALARPTIIEGSAARNLARACVRACLRACLPVCVPACTRICMYVCTRVRFSEEFFSRATHTVGGCYPCSV